MKKTLAILIAASFAFVGCSDQKLREAAEATANDSAVTWYEFRHTNIDESWLNGSEMEEHFKSCAVSKGYTNSASVSEFITIAKSQMRKAVNTLDGHRELNPPKTETP
jgi:hypothetical protein